MKKLYLFAALAAMLAACSENDLTAEKQVVQQNAEEGAVDFDVYVSRGTTRAGFDGALVTETTDGHNVGLKAIGASNGGFGVFAYYTDGEPYSGITKPNFMYNQLVKWNSTTWFYSPIKYWPNEFGSDAISDQVDRVTFFAYAPYVEVDPTTGVVKEEPENNIISMTRNTATGDPFIKYSATMDAGNSTDLCYGVAAENFISSNTKINPNNIPMGSPYVDVKKPGTDSKSKIKFDFKHALTQLNVTIDANVNDQTTASSVTTTVDSKTKIWVRSVTFEGVTLKGALNLYSSADGPEWYDINCSNKITSGSLTVYDGRKDNKEALDTATTENPRTLNYKIIQSGKYTKDASKLYIDENHPGVTSTAVNLFKCKGAAATALTDPVFVIPTGEKMKVTIVYDVETLDPSLAYYLSDGDTQGSTIQNTITKTIDAFGNIEAGKKYTLKLHLGMRSVDFDASVTAWDETTPAADIDLPSNLPQFYSLGDKAYNLGSIEIPYSFGVYDFTVSGLKAVEGVTASKVSGSEGDITSVFASDGSVSGKTNGAGVVFISAVHNKNNTVDDVEGKVQIEGTTSGKGGILTIVHKAHPLELKYVGYASKVITLSTSSEVTTYSTDLSGATITVKDLTTNTVLSANTPVGLTVTMVNALETGHSIKVTVEAGDVVESVTFTAP